MYLIVTRSFPPDSGGMQSLMWGLTNTISKNYMVKVFADESDKNKDIDKTVSFTIERIGGPKIIRKYITHMNTVLHKFEHLSSVTKKRFQNQLSKYSIMYCFFLISDCRQLLFFYELQKH